MKDILARNPQLDDIIRKAANRLGENHGLTRDNHGATIDNQGNSSRYVGSGGRHPYRYGQPTQPSSGGWHRTLNEGGCGDREMYEGGCGDYEGEMGEESPKSRYVKPFWQKKNWGLWENEDGEMVEGEICEDCGKVHEGACGGETYEREMQETEEGDRKPRKNQWPWEKYFDLEEDYELEEVTGASSAGGYEGPLFGTMTESERILKSVIREEVSRRVPKRLLQETFKDWFFTHFPGGLFGCKGPWWDNCDGGGMVIQGGGNPNDPIAFEEFMSSVEWPSDFGPKPRNMKQLKRLAGGKKNNLKESLKIE